MPVHYRLTPVDIRISLRIVDVANIRILFCRQLQRWDWNIGMRMKIGAILTEFFAGFRKDAKKIRDGKLGLR